MATLKPKTQAVLDWIRQFCQIEDFKAIAPESRYSPLYQGTGP
ncbi:MAG: hypothetical protein AAF289_19605 [Cyanobacteria bacterium P01_A01_bin.135]